MMISISEAAAQVLVSLVCGAVLGALVVAFSESIPWLDTGLVSWTNTVRIP